MRGDHIKKEKEDAFILLNAGIINYLIIDRKGFTVKFQTEGINFCFMRRGPYIKSFSPMQEFYS